MPCPPGAPRLAHTVIVSDRDPPQWDQLTNGRSLYKGLLDKSSVGLQSKAHKGCVLQGHLCIQLFGSLHHRTDT